MLHFSTPQIPRHIDLCVHTHTDFNPTQGHLPAPMKLFIIFITVWLGPVLLSALQQQTTIVSITPSITQYSLCCLPHQQLQYMHKLRCLPCCMVYHESAVKPSMNQTTPVRNEAVITRSSIPTLADEEPHILSRLICQCIL